MARKKRSGVRRDTERRRALEEEAAREVTEILREERGEVDHEVIAIAARDTERSPDKQELLDREKSRREAFYSDLLYSLCNVRYAEHEARLLWVNLLAHKTEMSDRLGRNVGIRVAALDYFKNIVGLLDEIRIVGGAEFVETERLAVTDGLTGLFNHRYFQNRLERAVARARELEMPLSLLMIDIDYFKQYNDLNGHIAGDVALREMASILRKSVKREDTVARYGGEEFAVILFDAAPSSAEKVAERLRCEVQNTDFPNEQVLPGGHLTVSVGLAGLPEDANTREDLISRADAALYAAKRAGRNLVRRPSQAQVIDGKLTASEVRACWRLAEEVDDPVKRAIVRDISPSGAALSVGSAPDAGSAIVVVLMGDFPGRQFEVPAEVTWRQQVPGASDLIGVRFAPRDPKSVAQLDKLTADTTKKFREPLRGSGA